MNSDSEHVGENNKSPNYSRKSGKETKTAEPKVAIIPTPLQPNGQESPHHCEVTCKQEKDWWNKFKPFIEIIGLASLLVYTGYTIKMYCANKEAADAAKKSADTAAKTLELDRPYLSVELVPTSDLEFTPEGNGYLRIGSTVVNYGRTPALNARIWVQFLNQAKGSPKSETDPNAFCENLQGKGNSSIESIFGGTYFPQVPYKASWIATESESVTAKVFMPTLIACVAYQSPFSENWLWAGEMYTIQRARHAKLGGTLLPSRGETVPQKDLVLAPFPNSAISK